MALVQIQVVNVTSRAGIGKTGKAYDFQTVECVVGLPDGSSRIAKINLDKEHKVENGKRYEVDFQPTTNYDNELDWRITSVKGQAGVLAKAA